MNDRHQLLFRLCAKAPFSLLDALARVDTLIPYYHVITNETLPHVRHLYAYKNVRQFCEDLDFLLRFYSPIGLKELLATVKACRPLPERALLLTFDDGYREISEIVAPILLAKGVNATFFVNSAFTDNKELCYLNKASLILDELEKRTSPGLNDKVFAILGSKATRADDLKTSILSITYQQRSMLDDVARVLELDFAAFLLRKKPYLTSDDIQKLIRHGFTIGGHSIDHPMYQLLPLADQLHQTRESVTFVKENFELSYGVFAFPFSDHQISNEFFDRISRDGIVDLSFGTAGLIEDTAPNHLQRFSLEKPIAPAARILAFQHAKRLKNIVVRNTRVVRQ